jgi:hypothetical protein
MHLRYPSSGQTGEPPRRPAPAPVRNAVKLMYAGAAVSTVTLMISLAIAIADVKAAARGRWLGYSLTAARLSHSQPLIVSLVVVFGLAVVALWLWMARANGHGRSWARILATVLAGLATLELTTNHGLGQVFWALTCLVGLGAVWLLWRPAASAFFKPEGVV